MSIINDIKKKVTGAVDQYRDISNRYDEEINRIEGEISALNDGIKQTRATIEEKVMNLDDTTVEEKQIEEAEAIIRRLTARLDIVKRGKRQALASTVPAIKAQLEAKREAVKDEVEKQIDAINRKRAELLKEVQKLYAIDAKAKSLYAEMMAIQQENGEKVPHFGNGSFIKDRGFLPIPEAWRDYGKDKTAERTLAVTQWMIEDAGNGKFPESLKKYL